MKKYMLIALLAASCGAAAEPDAIGVAESPLSLGSKFYLSHSDGSSYVQQVPIGFARDQDVRGIGSGIYLYQRSGPGTVMLPVKGDTYASQGLFTEDVRMQIGTFGSPVENTTVPLHSPDVNCFLSLGGISLSRAAVYPLGPQFFFFGNANINDYYSNKGTPFGTCTTTSVASDWNNMPTRQVAFLIGEWRPISTSKPQSGTDFNVRFDIDFPDFGVTNRHYEHFHVCSGTGNTNPCIND